MKRSLISMKRLTWWLYKWSLNLKSLCYRIKEILCFDSIICYLNRGNKLTDIMYNMNYMKVFEWLRKWFITLGELEKMFYLFLNSINWEILGQCEIRFEKSFKSYSNDQWLLCRKQTWFNMTDILHALITLKNRLLKGSQTTNDFSNI
jgi:hypothetical protein